jgi:Na+-transporting NADH:ubiquinone oxidoreductase subunit A
MIAHKIKRGYNIKISGIPEKIVSNIEKPELFALQPPDFYGVKPKLSVDVGSRVKIGSELFYNKIKPEVKFLSPASGKVSKINRGERRMVTEIVIEADQKDEYIRFKNWSRQDIKKLNREDIIEHLLLGGIWPYIRQRPFSKIADPSIIPRDIFVNAMDTAPLAPEMNLLLSGSEEYLSIGISILSKLTQNKIYLSIDKKSESIAESLFSIQDLEIHSFSGPHPAGNVSVQIYSIAPMKRGDIIWYINAADAVLIGKLFLEGVYPLERIVAVAGSSVKPEHRKYYKTRLGVPVQHLVKRQELFDESVRYISGNVLSGRWIADSGYLGFYDRLLTVIPENRGRDFFGWIYPGIKKPSFSRTFLSYFLPRSEYIHDTRLHGGIRPFIQTGDYEKVMPMDILPMHLVKSIIAEEIEEMEGLGLLECDPEDFALCSYICPSKIDFGSYIRKGLEILEKEG